MSRSGGESDLLFLHRNYVMHAISSNASCLLFPEPRVAHCSRDCSSAHVDSKNGEKMPSLNPSPDKVIQSLLDLLAGEECENRLAVEGKK